MGMEQKIRHALPMGITCWPLQAVPERRSMKPVQQALHHHSIAATRKMRRQCP
jgi:hypothetical protein